MSTCSFEDCESTAVKRGWCNKHYKRWLRNGDPAGKRPYYQTVPADGLCTLPECERSYYGRGFCKFHYQHHYRTGDPLKVRPRSPSGEANHKWVGDDVSYIGLHGRVRAKHGLARNYSCTFADTACHGRLEWANISHHYHGVDDFMPLCSYHHRRYDRLYRLGYPDLPVRK